MSDPGYLSSVLLGALQGATEFLPISSSGHLAILQRWIELDPGSPQMLLFDVMVHVGTLLAVAGVFAGSFQKFARRLLRESRSNFTGRRHGWRIVLLGVTASIPTAAIGLTFKDFFEEAFDRPLLIGICLMVTGTLLAITARLPKPSRGWGRFRWWQAALVGVAQAFAILPGISRSGATICTAAYFGLYRRWAAEFSFFIAVPAILGGAAIKLKDTLELPGDQFAATAWGPILAGSLMSLVVGIVALKLLLHVVRRAKLHYFSIYCWLLGGLIALGGV